MLLAHIETQEIALEDSLRNDANGASLETYYTLSSTESACAEEFFAWLE